MALTAEQIKVRDARRDALIQNIIEQMRDFRYLNIIADGSREAQVLRFRQHTLIAYIAIGTSDHLVVDAFHDKFNAEVMIPPTVWLHRVIEADGALTKWVAAMGTGTLHWTDREFGKNFDPKKATENFSSFGSVPTKMGAWEFLGFLGGEHSGPRDRYHPLYEDAIRMKALVEAWYLTANLREAKDRTIYAYWECMIGFAAWAALTLTTPTLTIGAKTYSGDAARTWLGNYIRGWETRGMAAFDVSSLPHASIQTSLYARILSVVVVSGGGTVSIDGSTDAIDLAAWVQFKPAYRAIPAD